MNEVKITLLGPSAVGKTSLLTSMYEQFQELTTQGNLLLIPDEESQAILDRRLEELRSLTETFKVQPGSGIQGTATVRSFIFDLARSDKQPFMRLHFYDYPGGFISQNSSPKQRQFIQNLLVNATAVAIAIDTPALMMSKGKFNEFVNKPKQIAEMFKEAYKTLDSPRLVIFAPVKCEMEMRNGDRSANLLLKAIEKEYADLLDFFQSPTLADKITVVVTPVQTVGSAICTMVEVPKQTYMPTFSFRKVRRDAEYAPQDNDQPLRYLLRFLLKLHHLQRTPNFLRPIVSWMGLDAGLKQSVTQFAKGCKTTGGFAVLQGKQWLEF